MLQMGYCSNYTYTPILYGMNEVIICDVKKTKISLSYTRFDEIHFYVDCRFEIREIFALVELTVLSPRGQDM